MVINTFGFKGNVADDKNRLTESDDKNSGIITQKTRQENNGHVYDQDCRKFSDDTIIKKYSKGFV